MGYISYIRDLQLGDQKVSLNHLEIDFWGTFFFFRIWIPIRSPIKKSIIKNHILGWFPSRFPCEKLWFLYAVHVRFVPFLLVLHPGRLTAGTYSHHPWKERKIIFQTPMIMFHVNLPGCKQIPFNHLGPRKSFWNWYPGGYEPKLSSNLLTLFC